MKPPSPQKDAGKKPHKHYQQTFVKMTSANLNHAMWLKYLVWCVLIAGVIAASIKKIVCFFFYICSCESISDQMPASTQHPISEKKKRV